MWPAVVKNKMRTNDSFMFVFRQLRRRIHYPRELLGGDADSSLFRLLRRSQISLASRHIWSGSIAAEWRRTLLEPEESRGACSPPVISQIPPC